MPAKFKPSEQILVDRQAKKYKTVNYFMHATTTKELLAAYENSNTKPKNKQNIRNELVKRKVLSPLGRVL
jgi:hypothetical protein|tara:strand:+ start:64 stop:273 length:210 start_codon:yes stop_codon:yes gene_type:complete